MTELRQRMLDALVGVNLISVQEVTRAIGMVGSAPMAPGWDYLSASTIVAQIERRRGTWNSS